MEGGEGCTPPLGPTSFNFTQFSAQILQNNRLANLPPRVSALLGAPKNVTLKLLLPVVKNAKQNKSPNMDDGVSCAAIFG